MSSTGSLQMLGEPGLAAALLAAGAVICLLVGVRLWAAQAALEWRLRVFVDEARGGGHPALAEPRLSLADAAAALAQRVSTGASALLPDRQVDRMRANLAAAGLPTSQHLAQFIAGKVVLAALAGLVALAAASASGRLAPARSLLVAGASATVGFYLPGIWLGKRIAARQHSIVLSLPDALDLLTISVGAGLGFDGALLEVVRRWQNPLIEEFLTLLRDLKLGKDRRLALRELAERTGVDEVASFAAAIIQADELGTPVRDALRVQAEQVRRQRRYRAEERARKAVVKMLLPMAFFIFPAMFVVLLGPAIPSMMSMFER